MEAVLRDCVEFVKLALIHSFSDGSRLWTLCDGKSTFCLVDSRRRVNIARSNVLLLLLLFLIGLLQFGNF